MVTASPTGVLGVTSWANDGPWLPLTGNKTMTGYITMAAELYINAGRSINLAGWYTEDTGIWSTTAFTFDGTSYYFNTPAGFSKQTTISSSNGSLGFDSDAKFYPKRVHITGSSYTLPVLAVGEALLLTFDVSICSLTASASQSVTWRGAGGANSAAAAGTANFESFGYNGSLDQTSAWVIGVSSTRVDIRG
jgi:hypothetical protein